jgi:menaquinone-dependent protoporphyrinogen oxidase
MSNILILYSTTDGQTLRICENLQSNLQQQGHAARVAPVQQGDSLNLEEFDKIVVGASIRYGKHSPLVFAFVRKHEALLNRKTSAFFTVNVVARKPEKNTPDTNPYMVKFLKLVRWQPTRLGVFAGRIDYPKLGWGDRTIIRFIMWMTKGPTDPKGTFEFTDWNKVEAFAHVIDRM